ncbi:DUF2914 domain-containing protein [Desulfoluna spongiiphila]|uniref:DUF2914 domain-containing protein n=1 Tax=Desulfoluna spongiiphila TaxID=419481 RepID=A0A1G5HGG1_9BACT|nr:DUF2914 domain-containing protein [Desulfoluna spongiiphila]SCY62794.1 Protein of unknown function [Desulfoluna spongiiphila]
MMKSFTTLLIAVFSLCAVSSIASAAPTLDDANPGEVTITAQSDQYPQAPAAETESVPMETVEPMEPMPPSDLEIAADTDEELSTPVLVTVSEMVIATGVAEREPVEIGTLFSTDTPRLFCHSRIASPEPTTITHVWYRDGQRVAEIPLNIGAAASWRTWSSKVIAPAIPAPWRVEILAEDGTLLAQTDFSVE